MVILDIIWNFAFVEVAVGVLVLSRDQSPDMPLEAVDNWVRFAVFVTYGLRLCGV